MRPFYEDIDVDKLSEYSEKIVLVELISGAYDRADDRYSATLASIITIKGSGSSEYTISHQYGWNRLQKLGGYYLIYLDSESRIVKTGSAIVPVVGFGGPFSDATLEEAVAAYELPEKSWFILSGKLWALDNCLSDNHPTCDREQELIEKTFNKAKHNAR